MNAGSEATDGGPVTLTDTLPIGPKGEQLVTVTDVVLDLVKNGDGLNATGEIGGETVPEPAGDCTTVPVRCTYPEAVPAGDWLLMGVYVTVNSGASGSLTNVATVSGGGAPGVSVRRSNQIASTPAPFGIASFGFYKDALNGTEETQAGGHPYELTTTIDPNEEIRNGIGSGTGETESIPSSVEEVKDIVVDLPLGFAGSTLAAPECTEAQLDSVDHCPPDTVVGHLTTEPHGDATAGTTINSPIWNIVPEYGHPAEFAYLDGLQGPHVAGYVSVVPSPEGYVLRFVASDLPEVILDRIVVTFYGDPSARDDTGASPQVPFFTNPTACSGSSQVAKIWIDSWHNPASFQPGSDGLIPANLEEPAWAKAESVSPPVKGCDELAFTPEIGSQPTTNKADSPSGLEFEQRLPQSEIFGTNATPALKNTVIAFPQGMTVDPSSADGLGTCSETQIGWLGPDGPNGASEPLPNHGLTNFSQGPPECPESSKIGTLELETPLIPGVLHGEVFLAAQNENPFGSTFATYIVVNDPVTGVVLKLAGEVKLNPENGQLTAVFDETPQLPFSALKVHFFGGPRAEFATPPNCGLYTTNSELTPWSAPDSGPSGTPFDNFAIDESCAIGFAPAFTGGSTNLQAGAYTTFQASFERQDDDQELGGAEVSLPPGMLADVPSVTECGEAELNAEEADAPTGGCPASSKVGTVEAGAGPGPNPLFVPGNVFWTGPHNGGPFGLAVVVSANPGPFHFGNVVVRQSIRVNPLTAAVTDVSDPFPTYLDPRGANEQVNGIPIKLRRVDIEINGRQGAGGWVPFTFNPTDCAKETFKVGGDISSTSAASKALATPFQVTNCRVLKFEPRFSVSAKAAKNTRLDGATLTAKLSYPSAPQGTFTNIARVKVELPEQLPSRLTTLRKACTAAQFNINPAGCSSASKIGFATVHTPILPVPLSGPAIFVSHGGEAFPSLTIVLQGDGVTVDVVGTTFISKAGVTSTTFKTVPDTPFSAFELTLPQGEFSALTALGNLCKQKLVMPTEFVAQNGAEIHEATRVAVGGCPRKARKASKRKARHDGHKAKRKGAGKR